MIADGWTYGPVKDAAARTHPLLVPFAQMPAEAQAKDRLFIAVVRALALRALYVPAIPSTVALPPSTLPEEVDERRSPKSRPAAAPARL
jgi:hypothetical protein